MILKYRTIWGKKILDIFAGLCHELCSALPQILALIQIQFNLSTSTSNATKRPQLKLSNDWCTQTCHTEIKVILASQLVADNETVNFVVACWSKRPGLSLPLMQREDSTNFLLAKTKFDDIIKC